jgi:hypothetical protein
MFEQKTYLEEHQLHRRPPIRRFVIQVRQSFSTLRCHLPFIPPPRPLTNSNIFQRLHRRPDQHVHPRPSFFDSSNSPTPLKISRLDKLEAGLATERRPFIDERLMDYVIIS